MRNFEDGLKLSIQRKIVGLLLQDLDSMVKNVMAIEREVDKARNIWDGGVVKDKKKERRSFSSGLEKKKKTSTLKGFRDRVMAIRAKPRVYHLHVKDISGLTASQGRGHVTISISLDT